MIEIHPLREKSELAELYKNSGVLMNENSVAVTAKDGDEVLGFCLFDECKDGLVIHALEPTDDLFLADGILRSALHVGVENGIMTAFYSETAPLNVFEKLKFIKNAEKRELSVEKLFSSCQNCSNT